MGIARGDCCIGIVFVLTLGEHTKCSKKNFKPK